MATLIPVDVVEALMGHEGYLTEAHRRYTPEDLADFYKKGKRVYLSDSQTRDLMKKLDEFFESKIEIPRIRVGKRQTIDALINEEAFAC